MTVKNAETPAGTAIRTFIENRVKAIHAKDVDGVAAHLAPDVLTFDVLNPLRNTGAEGIRQRAERWLSSYEGPVGYEIRDLAVTAGDDVAFCHYLYRVSGTLKQGAKVDMWVRSTVCFQKIDGEWRVTHQHDSVPFDAESGKASLDLKP